MRCGMLCWRWGTRAGRVQPWIIGGGGSSSPPPTLLVSERRWIPSGAFVHRSLALDDMAKVLRVGPVTAPIPLASG